MIVAAPVVPTTGALTPLGLDEVRITDGFWADRQQVNGTATLRDGKETGARGGRYLA